MEQRGKAPLIERAQAKTEAGVKVAESREGQKETLLWMVNLEQGL